MEEAAVAPVGHRRCARRIGADAVAFDQVARNAGAGEQAAVGGVAGDDVAGSRYRPADDIAHGAGGQFDASTSISQRLAAALVQTDVVALHNIIRSTYAADCNAAELVAGNHVA